MFDWGFLVLRQAWFPRGDISFTTKFQNEELNGVLEQYLKTTNRSEKVELFKQAQVIAAERAPMVYFVNRPISNFWQQNVSGFEPFPTQSPKFRSTAVR
jgi:ABC-type transport system substrate-binding protein